MGHLWCFTSSSDTRWEPCLLNGIRLNKFSTVESLYI
jgi:hypothetical protein